MFIVSTLIVSCSSTKEIDQQNPNIDHEFSFNEEEALNRLSGAIKHRTISLEDTTQINYQVYEEFIGFLKDNYPNLHSQAELKRIGKYSLLYKWKGTRPELKPALFMGHYDLVPVSSPADSLWEYSPFSGTIADGYIWGRGGQGIG